MGHGDLKKLFQEAITLLKEGQQIAIFSHLNPDPDAYGSTGGLASLLKNLGKEVSVFNPSGVFERQQYIPGVKDVLNCIPADYKPNLIVVCDCGDLLRVGDEFQEWIENSGITVINIDHHQSNPMFGKVNIVETTASSTSELIYDLSCEWDDLEFTEAAADCLLAGILGDTGGFRYRSTSSDTLRKAAALVEKGARLSFLTQHLFGSTPLSTLKLQGIGIEKLRVCCDGAIAGSSLTMADYDAAGANSEDAENLAEIIRDIHGVVISWTLRWMDGKWKASLRTTSESIDLSAVARSFGGGGHKAASAFRASGEVEEISERLETSLKKVYLESGLASSEGEGS